MRTLDFDVSCYFY